jgi:hypothetical protein
MEIHTAPEFADSLKLLVRHNTWWYKTYDLFRRDIPRFIKNIWLFRKGLWNYHWWDNHGVLIFVEKGLIDMSNNVEKHGIEVDIPRLLKVVAMRRAAQIIQNQNNDVYLEMAENKLGEIIHHEWEFEPVPDKPGFSQLVDNKTEEERKHNRKVFDYAREIEKEEWDELFHLLKGQDYTKFDKDIDWNKQFDGSGLKGWWD